MRVRFRSHGEEIKRIISGELKQISRKVDWYNPVFKEIENRNLKKALGYYLGPIDIEGNGNTLGETYRIKNISYKDGNVIIKWG